MKYVKQDNGMTCGVACYAMITGTIFTKAYNKFKKFTKISNTHGLSTLDIIKALRSVNYKIVGNNRRRPVGKKSWTGLPILSLVKVRPDGCPMYHWHWVVWNGKKIYDPAIGVKTPKEYKYDPISFLEILHG